MPVRTSDVISQIDAETVAKIFAYYSKKERTLPMVLKKFPVMGSEFHVRKLLKKEDPYGGRHQLYAEVTPQDMDAAQGKFFTKMRGPGTAKKEETVSVFEERNRILADAFRAKLRYDHSIEECRRAGLDIEQVHAYFDLVGEGDLCRG